MAVICFAWLFLINVKKIYRYLTLILYLETLPNLLIESVFLLFLVYVNQTFHLQKRWIYVFVFYLPNFLFLLFLLYCIYFWSIQKVLLFVINGKICIIKALANKPNEFQHLTRPKYDNRLTNNYPLLSLKSDLGFLYSGCQQMFHRPLSRKTTKKKTLRFVVFADIHNVNIPTITHSKLWIQTWAEMWALLVHDFTD